MKKAKVVFPVKIDEKIRSSVKKQGAKLVKAGKVVSTNAMAEAALKKVATLSIEDYENYYGQC